MNAEFYSLDQTTLKHTVDLNSYKPTGKEISGIDFFSSESRTCSLNFFEDGWANSNLRNLTVNDCIEGTNILKIVVIISSDVYYIKRESINYNKKTL